MKSPVIKPPAVSADQLTLSFEQGLADRFKTLRECIATGVYQRGLGNVAIDLNKAPGNLSVELSEDTTRRFSVDSLETYIERTKDFTPIYYLVDKFLQSTDHKQNEALAQLAPLMAQLAPLLRQAGLA